ncbi:hypothetical protein TWF103_005457, partial [Orbilia oligospora]
LLSIMRYIINPPAHYMHTGASCKNATDQAIDAAIDAYETQMGFGVLFSIVASTVSQTSTWNMYLPRPVALTFRILLVYSGARALEIRGSVVRFTGLQVRPGSGTRKLPLERNPGIFSWETTTY